VNDGIAIAAMGSLLLASASCSGSETACFNLTTEQLHEQERKGDRLGRTLVALMGQAERLLLVILIANNAINIAYFALASAWASRYVDDPAMASAITVGSLVGLILFGEIGPKVIAAERSLIVARIAAGPLWLLMTALAPVARAFEAVISKVTGPTDSNEDPVTNTVSAEELKLVIERSRDRGVVAPHIHDRLVEVVDLGTTPVYKAMTHRLDLPTVDRSGSLEDAVTALREQPGPYLLVMDDEGDGVGLLAAQDLLRDGRLGKRLRKAPYIPSVTTLSQALEIFQKDGALAGIVVDEYGGTEGILTLHHLGFELLGDGASEDLPDTDHLEQLDEDQWRISGTMSLEPWETLIGDPEITADCATIAGFIAKLLGNVPRETDRVMFNNLLFVVEKTEGRRITSVLVKKQSEEEARRMSRNMSL
jgi:CBS domain containing-hemolysin-like protein